MVTRILYNFFYNELYMQRFQRVACSLWYLISVTIIYKMRNYREKQANAVIFY